MMRKCLLLSTAALAAMAWQVHAAENLRIEFDQRGLASIVHNGVELVKPKDARFRLQVIGFADPKAKDGNRRLYEPKPTSERFDPVRKILIQEYDGCRVQCLFTPKANRLDMEITLLNRGGEVIRQAEFFPLTAHLPHTAANAFHGDRPFLVDPYEHENGIVIVTPVGHFTYGQREGLTESRPLSVPGPAPESRPHHPVADDSYWYDPGSMLPPGASGRYRVSLVFGPRGVAAEKLCPEAFAEYARFHPMEFHWPDRRPIATVFLCNSATGWSTNPRGYFQDATVDVTTEAGLRAFGERLMRYADDCINRMKKMGAQGVIVWDIEGEEMPHMISYIGDPRQLAALSPEMDRFADAFMKKFRDAGFRTGITIRPTEIYQPHQAGQLPWNQREVKDPVATMSAKIQYARRRWGCTIFYLDSSVFGDGMLSDEQKKQMRGIPWVMPSRMFEKLARLHPDCLISPEFATRDLYRFGAPYSSPNLNDGGTDPLIRGIWPEAFRLVAVREDLLEKRWEHFVDSVVKGDVLLFRPWFDAAENTFVALLYREAAIRRRGALTALAQADTATLARMASDPAEATRYAAAAALGKAGTPAAVAVLARLLKDDSPLVRKQALAGLAQAKRIDDPACIATLAEWIRGSQDPVQNALRNQAADALARAGDAAVPDLVVTLASDSGAAAWPYAVRALGRTGTVDATVGQALIIFFRDKTPAKPELRNDVIEALGLLKVKEAVPLLLPILDKRDRQSEDERGAAVVALGRIGDPRAVGPLIKQFNVVYATVVVYWIYDAIDTALRSITGQQHVIGKDEWRQWKESSSAR